MKSNRHRWLPRLALGAVLGLSTLARALPVELKDQNNTSYFINTQVSPLLTLSDASGGVANATYINAVTVTSTNTLTSTSTSPMPRERFLLLMGPAPGKCRPWPCSTDCR